MTIYLLLATPLLAGALSALLPRAQRTIIEYLAVAAGTLEICAASLLTSRVIARGTERASEMLTTDALGAFAALFISLVGLAAAIHSVGHLRAETTKNVIGLRRVKQYFILFHLFFFAMFLASATASPVLMWVAIEATTLASAFLVTFYNKPSALEAGWKFLIINSVGLLIGFLGTLLFLSAAAAAGESGAFVTWEKLRAIAPMLDPTLTKIAFIFIVVGFGTKVGLVPMHTWLPDAHSKAPIPISALLSGVLLNIALIGILRFRAIADVVLPHEFSEHLLLGFGITSLVIASLIILVQSNYKRLLAYSSIEHMGIITIGFALGGGALLYALFHMLYHALLKPILFFSAGNFFLKYSSTKIAGVRGALTVVPTSSILFLAALLAALGAPPSGIFFTKLGILGLGMASYPYLMALALMALLLVFVGFVRHANTMLFGEAPSDIARGEANAWTLVSIALLCAAFVGISVYIPDSFMELMIDATRVIS